MWGQRGSVGGSVPLSGHDQKQGSHKTEAEKQKRFEKLKHQSFFLSGCFFHQKSPIHSFFAKSIASSLPHGYRAAHNAEVNQITASNAKCESKLVWKKRMCPVWIGWKDREAH